MTPSIPLGANVILMDGQCIFCNGVVQFILAHDPHGIFHFAHLQSALAKERLSDATWTRVGPSPASRHQNVVR